MSTAAFYCFNPLNHPNPPPPPPTTTEETNPFHHLNGFFGNILVSQLETVNALKDLDSQVLNINYKSSQLEDSVRTLLDRCSDLESTINSLQKLIVNEQNTRRFAANPPPSTNYFAFNYSGNDPMFLNKQLDSERLTTLANASEFSEEGKSQKKVNQDMILHPAFLGGNFNRTPDMRANMMPANVNGTVKITNYFQHNSCFYCSSQQANRTVQLANLAHTETALPNKQLSIENKEPVLDIKEIQRQFNKRVKYEVNKRFGLNYLADHQVRDLDVKDMQRIRRKTLRLFKLPIPDKSAWNNAMNSLRQDRHQLNKRRRLSLVSKREKLKKETKFKTKSRSTKVEEN